MISLVLLFGFLCRSSIFRYPDDLRNIVQQCANDTHAVCPQPLREKLEQSRAASQESETYQINTDDDNYNVDGYEYNDV